MNSKQKLERLKGILSDPQYQLELTPGGFYIYRFTPELMNELATLLGVEWNMPKRIILVPGRNKVTRDGFDIIAKYGLPREHCSCPDCGKVYGHHKTTVCETCECCSTCCKCNKKDQKLMDPMEFLKKHT